MVYSINNTDEQKVFLKCPGCDMVHVVYYGTDRKPSWTYNGCLDRPTISPSILVRYQWGKELEQHVCHSFVVDGVWQFLSDCTHSLAGQNVPLIEFEW